MSLDEYENKANELRQKFTGDRLAYVLGSLAGEISNCAWQPWIRQSALEFADKLNRESEQAGDWAAGMDQHFRSN